MRKKINKAIALLAVLGILAGSGNVVYGNEENIADQEEQLTRKKKVFILIIPDATKGWKLLTVRDMFRKSQKTK